MIVTFTICLDCLQSRFISTRYNRSKFSFRQKDFEQVASQFFFGQTFFVREIGGDKNRSLCPFWSGNTTSLRSVFAWTKGKAESWIGCGVVMHWTRVILRVQSHMNLSCLLSGTNQSGPQLVLFHNYVIFVSKCRMSRPSQLCVVSSPMIWESRWYENAGWPSFLSEASTLLIELLQRPWIFRYLDGNYLQIRFRKYEGSFWQNISVLHLLFKLLSWLSLLDTDAASFYRRT